MNNLPRFTRSLAAAAGLAFAVAATAGDDKMQKMDGNNDGMISAEEHSAGAREKFKKLDADTDGRVTAAEMDAMHAKSKTGDSAAPKMSSAEKIRTIDSNNDGAITAAEHEAGARAKFSEMDTNADGKLSSEEWQAGHAKLTGDGRN